ncbi:hypothetical protein Tco_0687548 [Tanacetum coccineum]
MVARTLNVENDHFQPTNDNGEILGPELVSNKKTLEWGGTNISLPSRISSGQEALTVVHKDNAACIAQLKDGYIKGDKTKHILPKFFFTHNLQNSVDIIVQKLRSSDNQVDLFAKALPTTTFKKLVQDTGMRRLGENIRLLEGHPVLPADSMILQRKLGLKLISTTSTTPIVEKIDKMKRLIIDGTATLVDDEGKPLTMIDYAGDHDSEDEKESYGNGEYDYDPYDDDMYEGHDISYKIQDICDNLDIKIGGIGVSTESDDTINEDTPVGGASAVKEGVTPFLFEMTMEIEKPSSLEDTTRLRSFLPLSTRVTTTAGNAPGKSSYPNITSEPSGKKLNIRTLFRPGGNGIDVVVPVKSIQAISERFVNTTYGFFLGKRVAYPVVANYVKLHGVPVKSFSEDGLSDIVTKLGTLMLDSYTSDMCMQSWGRSSYAKVMIKLRADVDIASCKVFGHIHEECPKNTGAGEKKTLKKPSQTSRGVPVGAKMGFKPQKEYRHVPKKPTCSSSNKKKGVEPTIEVSNSNPFEVLNSVNNEVELGTNRGATNLVNNGVTSSGSSFMNVDNSSTGTTPITHKIRKFEELLTIGQAIIVDEAGNPLKKVEFPGDYDSEDEVALVDNDMARPYGNGDYDDDPYDDDMYECQDLSQELQDIYDNLDIRVLGRKKK